MRPPQKRAWLTNRWISRVLKKGPSNSMWLDVVWFGSFKIAAICESRIYTLLESADLQHVAHRRTFGGLFSGSVKNTVERNALIHGAPPQEGHRSKYFDRVLQQRAWCAWAKGSSVDAISIAVWCLKGGFVWMGHDRSEDWSSGCRDENYLGQDSLIGPSLSLAEWCTLRMVLCQPNLVILKLIYVCVCGV